MQNLLQEQLKNTFKSNIIKPIFDTRNIIGGKLENNIKYVLINDKSLDKSYIVINIKAGSFHEPKGYDGLAHFLEHMLFMGSEKYKEENYFMEQIKQYGGMSNAYTADTETCYYLSVFTEGLEKIIDIFSRFFIDPLFLQDSVEREVNAVNNEHLKNINDDNWIFEHFVRHISTNKNIFTTGSLETLDKDNIKSMMIEFYKKYYVSSNISIAIASKENLDKVKILLEKTFGIIENKTNNEILDRIKIDNIRDYYLKSITETYDLYYIWQIPEQLHSGQFKTQEFNILAIALSINKINTLRFYLTNHGYVTALSTNINDSGLFMICFSLTKFGVKNIKFIDCILYAYLELIYKIDINKLCLELNNINRKNFDYNNKIETLSLCKLLASNHHYYNVKYIYINDNIIEGIKESSHYIDFYRKYINKDNQIRIFHSHKLNDFKLIGEMIDIDYYNSQYGHVNLPFTSIDEINSFNIKLETIDISKNIYSDVMPKMIPDLDMFEKSYLIDNKYWYGGSSQFNEPIIYFHLNFSNSILFRNEKRYLLTYLSCTVFRYLVKIILFDAFALGYGIGINPSNKTSSINISGSCLNDITKFKLFIKQIEDFILNIKTHLVLITDTLISNIINNYKMNIKNIEFYNSNNYNKYILSLLMLSNEYSYSNLLIVLETITPKMIRKYISKIFDDSALTIMVYGNIKSEDLPSFASFKKQTQNCLCPLPKLSPFWLPIWSCDSDICPINDNSIVLPHPNKKQKSNSVIYYFNIGSFTPKICVLAIMVIDILQEIFFNELRTKKQLGYLVNMYCYNTLNNYCIMQNIQSNKSIEIIMKEIDTFNKNIMTHVKEIDMKQYKDRAYAIITENDTSTAESYSRYNGEIMNRTYMFDREEVLSQQVPKITFNDIKEFINRIINSSNCIKIITKGN